jgi:hypothetical protein
MGLRTAIDFEVRRAACDDIPCYIPAMRTFSL